MLVSLSISNLVLIESLTLSFESGLSVLTGETGAGKSILLDALGLALGMRGDTSLIRAGTDQAIVTAEFVVKSDHVIFDLLKNHGLIPAETLIFRRIIAANGRSRAFVNDQLVSVGLLRQLGDMLLEIHGQFDRLLDAGIHRQLLDDFAHNAVLKDTVRQAYEAWQESVDKWRQSQERLDMLKREEDFLRFQLLALKKLDLQENEEETLLAQRQALSHVGKLYDAVQSAWKSLGGTALLDAMQGGQRALQKCQDLQDPKIMGALSSLTKAVSEMTEAISLLEEVQESFADSPEKLVLIDDRLHALRAAARKHGVTIAELPGYYQKLSEDLDNLDQAEGISQKLWLESERLGEAYKAAAQSLYENRAQAACDLDRSVGQELPALRLPQARFFTAVTLSPESAWSAQGIDHIEFQVAMNKGQEFCSLTKAASGGELARLMLALKAVLAAKSEIGTIIFDEIDIGVGGAVAAAIGQRFNALAQHVQVLAITHSPQVAASAQRHYHVSKADGGNKMRTNVVVLPLEKRYEELARMLSGAEITQEALAAAKTLLKAS